MASRNPRSAMLPVLSRARERASIPSAQVVWHARAFMVSRWKTSVASSVRPVRAADSISSVMPQLWATISRGSAQALRAAAKASSYWPRPLHRTARAYSLMATPTPSPRAVTSPIVASISSRTSRAWPRHAVRTSAPYGASAIPAASCTDRDSSFNEESRSVHEAAGIAEAPYGALVLTAWRGQAREVRELIDATIGEVTARGEGVGVAISEYARAVLCNGLGQYDEAFAAARSACADPREMVAHNWGMTELIESAARTGRTELATDVFQRLTMKARACQTTWALGIEARSRALLSTGSIAERGFREAIDY